MGKKKRMGGSQGTTKLLITETVRTKSFIQNPGLTRKKNFQICDK